MLANRLGETSDSARRGGLDQPVALQRLLDVRNMGVPGSGESTAPGIIGPFGRQRGIRPRAQMSATAARAEADP